MEILLREAAADGTCIGEMSPGNFDAAEYDIGYLLKSASNLEEKSTEVVFVLVEGVFGAECDVDFSFR